MATLYQVGDKIMKNLFPWLDFSPEPLYTPQTTGRGELIGGAKVVVVAVSVSMPLIEGMMGCKGWQRAF